MDADRGPPRLRPDDGGGRRRRDRRGTRPRRGRNRRQQLAAVHRAERDRRPARVNGTIDSVHERRAPNPGENGESIRASGEGRYVLEVNRGWTDERGVEPGDRVEFDVPE
ncbi:hypothetical protein BRD02_08850 [Halobacteriales archaeon QS_8_69_73]|nr:MAG: hypothetical protein BRD02_08850 [Halobacteriales archaeon QS_8_69_73]